MNELASFIYKRKASTVACGYGHTVFIQDGKLYGFESNGNVYSGALANYWPEVLPLEEQPLSVSCGGFHTLVITTSGNLYIFKCVGATTAKKYLPDATKVEFDEKIIMADGGDKHSIVVTESGKLYRFGLECKPRLIPFDKSITSVHCNEDCTAIITEGGELYLINALDEIKFVPCKEQLVSAIVRDFSITVLSESGKLYKEKDCSFYIIDRGVTQFCFYNMGSLTRIRQGKAYHYKLIACKEEVVEISCGYFHMIARGKGGRLYSFGNRYRSKNNHGSDELSLLVLP